MPPPDLRAAMLADAIAAFTRLRSTADGAVSQVDDEAFFTALGPEENSIAVLMQHVGGNLRSRFSRFLETDGEKPDRDRDAEFEVAAGRARRQDVLAIWTGGWETVLGSLRSLEPPDIDRMVTLRGEPLAVRQAIDRSALHVAGHVGQIVLLAKHHAGARWRTLSIPRKRPRSP